MGGGGSIAQWFAYLRPDPASLGLIPSIPEIFSASLRFISGAG